MIIQSQPSGMLARPGERERAGHRAAGSF